MWRVLYWNVAMKHSRLWGTRLTHRIWFQKTDNEISAIFIDWFWSEPWWKDVLSCKSTFPYNFGWILQRSQTYMKPKNFVILFTNYEHKCNVMFNYLTFFRRKFRYHNPSVAIPKKTRHRVEQLHILWNRCPLSASVPLFEELFQISRNLVHNLWNYSTQYGTVPLCVGLLGCCPLRWNNAFVTFLTSIQLSTSPDLPSKTGQHRQRCWQGGKKLGKLGPALELGFGIWNWGLGSESAGGYWGLDLELGAGI